MGGGLDRRAFLARGAATAAGVVAAGAGLVVPALPAGARTNGPGRNGITRATPRRGGTLVFGVDAEEQGFNPFTARFDEVGVMYARTVFDPLCIITADGNVAPYLAQSVIPNADYTSWTVTLRPGITFHDGTPCDGAALLMNLEAAQASSLISLATAAVVSGVRQTGPLSVQLDLHYPWVPFPFYLTGGIGGQIAYVVAPSMLRAPDGGTDHPVGTGPFRFVEWQPNEHFTAAANPHYWRPGLPYLDAITYRPIPDGIALSEALESGTVDLIVTDLPENILSYRGKRQWSYVDDSGPVVGEPDMNCLLLNLSKPPFDNPKVRRAAAMGDNPAEYARVVDLGVNAPSRGLFVPGTPYYSKTAYPSYDPAGAKRLIGEVERETGKPVTFTLSTLGDPTTLRAAQYLQQNFGATGITVTLATFDQNVLIDNALAGNFQASTWRQFGAVNPDMNYIYWSPTTVGSGLSLNMARNTDPRVEAALQAGRRSTSAATRAQAYQTVNKLFASDLPYLWGDRATWAIVAHPTVQNFNNPTTPGGGAAYGMIGGSIWPTQVWLQR